MWEAILEAISPKFCLGCGKSGDYICKGCKKALVQVPLMCPVCFRDSTGGRTHEKCRNRDCLDGLIVVFRYQGLVRKAIFRIKYGFRYAVSDRLVEAVLEVMQAREKEFTEFSKVLLSKPVVVAVPLYWARRNWRGFNQAQAISKILEKKWSLTSAEILVRAKLRERQAKLDKKGRLSNVKGIFRMDSGQIAPEKVVLVDDVWTTGATMKECARVLKKAGVREIWAVALAR
jgi:competence protein ComFC